MSQDEVPQTQETTDKEINFRKQEQALSAKYERKLEEQQQQIQALMDKMNAKQTKAEDDDEEDDSEPYVDHRKLKKTLNSFGQKNKNETMEDVKRIIQEARSEERREMWKEQHLDFAEVMEKAEDFAKANPALAKTILAMPDTFERQQLVYNNIKAFGAFKQPETNIQDKINKNRGGQFYRPSSQGSAPYSAQGDFSSQGQKSAYDKMKELQSRMKAGY